MVADPETRPRRLIVACHIRWWPRRPTWTRAGRQADEERRRGPRLAGGVGPHLYCCGHVHAAWAYSPPDLPGHSASTPGAPSSATRPACARPASWRSTSTATAYRAPPRLDRHRGRSSRCTRTRASSPRRVRRPARRDSEPGGLRSADRITAARGGPRVRPGASDGLGLSSCSASVEARGAAPLPVAREAAEASTGPPGSRAGRTVTTSSRTWANPPSTKSRRVASPSRMRSSPKPRRPIKGVRPGKTPSSPS